MTPKDPHALSASLRTASDTDDPSTSPVAFDNFLNTIEAAIRKKLEGCPESDINFLIPPADRNLQSSDDLLTPQDQLLVYAVAKGGQTHAELGKLLGVGPQCIGHRLKEPKIARAVSLIQHASGLTDVIARFKNLTPRAVEVMAEIMNDKDNPASTRLEAAKTIIERIHGKALQPIEANGNILSTFLERLDKSDEISNLAKELPDDDSIH